MGDTVRNIYYKSETTLPFKADLLARENGFIKGGSADNVATENGLKFHVDWLKGQKTGFFVDQRENRHLLEHYARGRNVLNMFCYTGTECAEHVLLYRRILFLCHAWRGELSAFGG